MKLWQIGLVSVAAGMSLPAVAQMDWGPQTRTEVEARVKERLGKFDANKDGTVTSAEMKAFADARAKSRADERFAAMDTDKNGSISKAEFEAAQADGASRRDRVVSIGRQGGPEGAIPPLPREGMAKRADHIRMMFAGRDGTMMMADGDAKGIVIADAVKKALTRFDATDTDKDGTLSPEEREAARKAWRAKARTMTGLSPKVG